MSRRFVALDRDGTVVVLHPYLSDPARLELCEGAAEGLRRLRRLGLGLILVTNQSAVGRGLIDEARLGEIHERLRALLADEGIELDGVYYCPHTPEQRCACRKPRTGMIDRAARELGFAAAEGFVVGDHESDIELGAAVGATTLLVRSGYGAEVEARATAAPDHVVDDLVGAAQVIAALLGDPATGKMLD